MRVAYLKLVLIDPSLAGASGDKLVSAFASASGRGKDLGAAINDALLAIGRAGSEVSFEEVESHGIKGIRLNLSVSGPDEKKEDAIRTAGEALDTLDAAAEAIGLSEFGKKRARSTMELLISTERESHGSDILHELGSIDTVVDIIGTFKGIELLGAEDALFFTTPVAVGCGSVHSLHGVLPVPAPATLMIMSRSGLPIARSGAQQELTTPTGAALLSILTAGRFEFPPFRAAPRGFGVGIGKIDLGFPNVTRVVLGESISGIAEEEIFLVETNVDDVDGEVLGWVFEKLSGLAEDVCIIPILTKKNRPGHLIRAVSAADSVAKVIDSIFEETGTLGVKVSRWNRVKAAREECVVDVNIKGRPYAIRVKTNLRTGTFKPSYDDCRMVALEANMPLRSVVDLVREEFQCKRKKAY